MSYRIQRKWSDYDEGYISPYGSEGHSFEAKTFSSKEEAERAKSSLTWHLDGLSSDFEVTDK